MLNRGFMVVLGDGFRLRHRRDAISRNQFFVATRAHETEAYNELPAWDVLGALRIKRGAEERPSSDALLVAIASACAMTA